MKQPFAMAMARALLAVVLLVASSSPSDAKRVMFVYDGVVDGEAALQNLTTNFTTMIDPEMVVDRNQLLASPLASLATDGLPPSLIHRIKHLLKEMKGNSNGRFDALTLTEEYPIEQKAKLARWLVHSGTYGTLSTLGSAGIPMGSILSHSDGLPNNSTGRLLFYMTPMDIATINIDANPNSTFTISGAEVTPSKCAVLDPENPLCMQISLTGVVAKVDPDDTYAVKEAKVYLFSRHPQMALWPADHDFAPYEMQIERIRLLSSFGGAHEIPLDEYFAVDDI